MHLRIPYFEQAKDYTCGPAVLKMALLFFGKKISESTLSKQMGTKSRVGTSHKALVATARAHRLHVRARQHSSLADIHAYIKKGFAIIVHFIEPSDNQRVGHYAIVTRLHDNAIYLNDPWNGKRFSISEKEFVKRWHSRQGARTSRRWMMVVSKLKPYL